MVRKLIGKFLERITIRNLRESIKARILVKGTILDNGSGFRGSWDYGTQKDIFSIDTLYGDDCVNLTFEDKLFDMVVFAGVIQYVKDYDKAIKQIHRVLKSNGMFIITTVNNDSFLRNIGLIKKQAKYNENKIFTIKEIETLLEKNGFVIIEKWGACFFPFSFEQSSNICYLARKK
jgi:SAM-dependent methyltransferase